jgi:hypothetical protein
MRVVGAGAGVLVPCSNCGDPSGRRYPLRFSHEGYAPRTLRLQLCDSCLDDLLEDETIDLIDEQRASLNGGVDRSWPG